MRVEKEGAKNEGGFFHMFDWTSKSRKKLFSTTPGTCTTCLGFDECLCLLSIVILVYKFIGSITHCVLLLISFFFNISRVLETKKKS